MNFATARFEVQNMTSRDTLPRFKRTPEFAKALAEARQAVQKLILHKEKERETYEKLIKQYE